MLATDHFTNPFVVGTLTFIADIARVDIAFSVVFIMTFTITETILLKSCILADADWAGNAEDRSSQSGETTMLNGSIISWSSRKQI